MADSLGLGVFGVFCHSAVSTRKLIYWDGRNWKTRNIHSHTHTFKDQNSVVVVNKTEPHIRRALIDSPISFLWLFSAFIHFPPSTIFIGAGWFASLDLATYC
jgi:hypothetical protein